jgi:hypothetical protein
MATVSTIANAPSLLDKADDGGRERYGESRAPMPLSNGFWQVDHPVRIGNLTRLQFPDRSPGTHTRWRVPHCSNPQFDLVVLDGEPTRDQVLCPLARGPGPIGHVSGPPPNPHGYSYPGLERAGPAR